MWFPLGPWQLKDLLSSAIVKSLIPFLSNMKVDSYFSGEHDESHHVSG